MLPVIYSMSVSLDGFIAGPDGDISWSAPDSEGMRFHIEQTRHIAAHLCGRGLGGNRAVGEQHCEQSTRVWRKEEQAQQEQLGRHRLEADVLRHVEDEHLRQVERAHQCSGRGRSGQQE
jgi:hypothetical protein